jgi:cation diffusion facilitator CzcD-associated flavoprotein CzcO
LSIPQWPKIEGICEDGGDDFEGLSFHTFYAPHEPVDYSGKRVAVIGTGATGIQVIAEVAKTAGHLTVFQRHPNWASPLHNRKITPAEQADIRARYDEILKLCGETYGGFVHVPDERLAFQVPEEEREALWEKLYGEPGFAIIMANFRDLVVVEQSNKMISDFIARKIRERVHDPVTAEKLIPKDHGFGTRRLPLESGYYEVYNQDNVRLVDLLETPLVRITPKGIETTAGETEFDIIIYATGFHAITGAFDRIEIRGEGGELLTEHWQDGPRTYLGMASKGFPNLLAVVGPHNVTTFCNMPRCIEYNVEWIGDLLVHMREHGFTRVEPTTEAEDAWTDTVYQDASRFLFMRVDSWFTGVHGNERGVKPRRPMVYTGGAPMYRGRCDEVAAQGYTGFVLD